jgi:O-acetyl-ADP-ribose deacetylase (regulator of RNase III)
MPVAVAVCPGRNFPARYVIHVNSPMWSSQNQSAIPNLEKAITNILKLADEKQLKVIAIPSVSSGR